MAHYNTILGQITAFIPRHDFDYHANIHHNGQKFRSYNRWSQFMAMMIGQLSGRKSLRDLTENLTVQHKRLYHLGMKPTSKSKRFWVDHETQCSLKYGSRSAYICWLPFSILKQNWAFQCTRCSEFYSWTCFPGWICMICFALLTSNTLNLHNFYCWIKLWDSTGINYLVFICPYLDLSGVCHYLVLLHLISEIAET